MMCQLVNVFFFVVDVVSYMVLFQRLSNLRFMSTLPENLKLSLKDVDSLKCHKFNKRTKPFI